MDSMGNDRNNIGTQSTWERSFRKRSLEDTSLFERGNSNGILCGSSVWERSLEKNHSETRVADNFLEGP